MSDESKSVTAVDFLIISDALVVELSRIAKSLPPEQSDEIHLLLDRYRKSLAEYREFVVATVNPPMPQPPPGPGHDEELDAGNPS